MKTFLVFLFDFLEILDDAHGLLPTAHCSLQKRLLS